jgi:hypothetical protein
MRFHWQWHMDVLDWFNVAVGTAAIAVAIKANRKLRRLGR